MNTNLSAFNLFTLATKIDRLDCEPEMGAYRLIGSTHQFGLSYLEIYTLTAHDLGSISVGHYSPGEMADDWGDDYYGILHPRLVAKMRETFPPFLAMMGDPDNAETRLRYAMEWCFHTLIKIEAERGVIFRFRDRTRSWALSSFVEGIENVNLSHPESRDLAFCTVRAAILADYAKASELATRKAMAALG